MLSPPFLRPRHESYVVRVSSQQRFVRSENSNFARWRWRIEIIFWLVVWLPFFGIFPLILDISNHPNWRSHIFQDGVFPQAPSSIPSGQWSVAKLRRWKTLPPRRWVQKNLGNDHQEPMGQITVGFSMGKSTLSMGHGFKFANCKRLPEGMCVYTCMYLSIYIYVYYYI